MPAAALFIFSELSFQQANLLCVLGKQEQR